MTEQEKCLESMVDRLMERCEALFEEHQKVLAENDELREELAEQAKQLSSMRGA